MTKLTRHLLVEKPRVTKFQIQWEDASVLAAQMAAQTGMLPTENDINQLNMMQQQQQIQEGCLQPGTQFQDRNDMMSSTNLQAVAGYFQAPQ